MTGTFWELAQKEKSKRRSDYGTVQTTERDIHILQWIGQMYAARVDHLQILAGRNPVEERSYRSGKASPGTVEQLYRRWLKAGWVEKSKILAGKPQWIWLSKKGLTHIGLKYPYRVPAVTRLRHIYYVNAVRLYVERKLGNTAQWVSERDVNQVRKDHGRNHLVDGEVFFRDTRIGVEVELVRKSQKRLESILRELKRDYEAVWYFADDKCYNTVKTAVESVKDHEETFVLYSLSDVL